MASMLVSGNEALQANSDKHLTASWKESMVAAKCFSNTFAVRGTKTKYISHRGAGGWQEAPEHGLTDDVAGGLEGEFHDALVLVRCCQVEDGEDVLPS